MSWSHDREPLGDHEYPDPDDDEFETTVPCPSCGQEVFDDAEQCPHCHDYLTHDGSHVWSGRPTWWILIGIVGVLGTIWALLGL